MNQKTPVANLWSSSQKPKRFGSSIKKSESHMKRRANVYIEEDAPVKASIHDGADEVEFCIGGDFSPKYDGGLDTNLATVALQGKSTWKSSVSQHPLLFLPFFRANNLF